MPNARVYNPRISSWEHKMKGFLIVSILAVLAFAACGSNEGGSDQGGNHDADYDIPGYDATGDTVAGDSGRDAAGNDGTGDDIQGQDVPAETSLPDADEDHGQSDVPADVDEDTGAVELCPYPTKIEIEDFNRSGGNDEFADAQPIIMGSDVTGFIGLAGDEDWYAFCPPADGIVNIHIDFTDSYNAMGINWMMFAAYTDEFPASNVSVASSEYDGTPFVMHPLDCGLTTIDVQMSVKASVGRYAFKLVGYGDGEFFPGFDQANPYTFSVTMVPGDDLEADQPAVEGAVDYGSIDTWRDATELILDENGEVSVQSYGWYWNDIDWYKVHIDWPGWVSVVARIEPLLDGDGYALVDFNGSIIRMCADGPEELEGETAIEWIAPYNEGCGTNRGEQFVFGGADYYIRTFSAPGNQTIPYQFTFRYVNAGTPEDDQPEVGGAAVGAAEDHTDAFDMGELALGGTLTVSSYAWHYFDWDWYSFTVPENASQNVTVTWDYTASYNAKGWHSCPDNEDGIENWMYMFDESSKEFPGIAQGYEDDVPVQTMTTPVVAGMTYYILVMSREDWDTENPYTITVTGTP